MLEYDETERWIHECYEETAETLSKKYSSATIFIVRPSRREQIVFSEFDHFYVGGKCVLHLQALIQSAKRELSKSFDTQ